MNKNKGFTPILITLIIVGILVVGGGTYYIIKNSKTIPVQNEKENNNTLPDSFTIEMYGNYSSSGADRNYSSELTFIDNKISSGFQNYKVGEGSICKENCNRITECVVKDQKWVDKFTGGECMIDTFSAPLTKEGIMQQIKEGKILLSENIYQCHYSTCYKIKDEGIVSDINNIEEDDNMIIDNKELKKIELSSVDDEKNVVVTKGQIIAITVRNPGDGGFRFDDPKYDSSILQLKNKTHITGMIDPDVNVVRTGDFGEDIFEFESINIGKSKIDITASQLWDGGIKLRNIFSATIIVK
jgi:hypothetical protein